MYCRECNKNFTLPESLRRHSYEHKKAGNFECDQCDMKFSFSSVLKEHKSSHLKKGQFACFSKNCDRKFKHKGDLKRHVKQHQDNNYTCQQCTYSTSDYRNYKNHGRIHTNIKPYKCSLCTEKFKWTTQCLCHLKNTHTWMYTISIILL